MQAMEFDIAGGRHSAEIRDLVIAGWTGRDAASVEHHIAELEAIGVARPRTVPCFYRVGANLLTTATHLDFTGPDSSGEVEFVLVSLPEGLFVGVGSDHTDRKVEAYGVTVSKQMCPKPVSRELWSFADVQGHWDSLILRSWVTRDDKTELYQEGLVTRMLAPLDLIARYTGGESKLPAGTAMYCGTMPLLAKMGAAAHFEMELEDSVLRRKLRHEYDSRELPYND
jgi:hypothetical protein